MLKNKEKELGPVERFFALMFFRHPWTKGMVVVGMFALLAFCLFFGMTVNLWGMAKLDTLLMKSFFVFSCVSCFFIIFRLFLDCCDVYKLPEYKAKKILEKIDPFLTKMMVEGEGDSSAGLVLSMLRNNLIRDPNYHENAGKWVDKYKEIREIEEEIEFLQEASKKIKSLEEDVIKRRAELGI